MIISIFNCKTIESEQRLSRDMQIPCWQERHLIWSIGWGVPMMLVWVFGFPIAGTLFLFFRRKKLEEPAFMSKYMVFY